MGPVNSTRRRRANEPKAANRLTWGSEKATWAMAKTEGITTAARTERLTTSRSGSLDLSQPRAPLRRPRGAGTDVVVALVIRTVPSFRRPRRRASDTLGAARGRAEPTWPHQGELWPRPETITAR